MLVAVCKQEGFEIVTRMVYDLFKPPLTFFTVDTYSGAWHTKNKNAQM